MSETKWTPGPWRARIAKDGSGDIGIITDTPRGCVAEFFDEIRKPDERAQEEQAANVALFLAAPALYEALEALAGAADDVGVACFDCEDMPMEVVRMRAATEAARAALAAARGES